MRVTYLLGAGASQACIKLKKSPHGILTQEIIVETAQAISARLAATPSRDPTIEELVNDISRGRFDVEQLITLLEESSARHHRNLASDLREVFEQVLQDRLKLIRKETTDPAFLYAALIDMHNVRDADEQLHGFLTLNYDLLLEEAIQGVLGLGVDYGLAVAGLPDRDRKLPVLKLHGSFGWTDDWPIRSEDDANLWIPPGFHKRKERYPFNLLWGKARELLDCDVLRIIGCQVGLNDWDLISLIFATRHANAARRPYTIEIIDWPQMAETIKARFAYLDARSLFELETVGEQFLSEVMAGPPRSYDSLSDDEKIQALEAAGRKIRNPFFEWLRQKAEGMHRDLGSITTKDGIFEQLLAA